jgi:hypothetical protein
LDDAAKESPLQVSAKVSSTANSVKFDTRELFADLDSRTSLVGFQLRLGVDPQRRAAA